MRVLLAIVLSSSLLSGCALFKKPEPVIRTVTVKVMVKEPCISKAPVKPVYRFGKGDAPAEREMAKLLADDFEAAERYGSDWEAAAVGCVAL